MQTQHRIIIAFGSALGLLLMVYFIRNAIRRGHMPPLDLQTICDKRNNSRAHGNYRQCSKQRQIEGIARRATENQ